MTTLSLATIATLLATTALAHDLGCNGKSIPPNVKAQCCGKADAHLVGPNNTTFPLSQLPNGDWQLTVGAHQHTWTEAEVIPSNDGCYWAWWSLGASVTDCGPEQGACDHPKTLSERPIIFYCLSIPYAI